MKVLIVDDNPTDRARIAEVLCRAFGDAVLVEVARRSDLDTALANADIDVVLTESQLPWIDGLSLLRLVRARWPHVPVLMVTAAESETAYVAGMQAGLSDVVLKQQLYRLPHAVRHSLDHSPLRQQHLHFLGEASAALASSLDYEATLKTIAKLAVPAIADWAFVEMLEADGSIKRLAMAQADPGKEALVREFDRRYPLDPNAPEGSAKVIRTGRPELIPEIPDAILEAVAQDAEHLRILRALGFRSSMIVPLRARGRTLGDLALVAAESGRRYDEGHLAIAQELATRAALAIDNARLYREAQEQRERLAVTLSSIGDAVIATDPRGRVTFMNRVAEAMTGCTQVDAEGTALSQLFSIVDEATREPVESPATRVLREGTVVGLGNQAILLAKDGTEIPVDASGAPIKDEQGHITGVVLVLHDITERKQAERELRNSRDQLAIIVEGVTDGITLQLPGGQLAYANDAAARICGYPSAQALLATPVREVMSKFELMDEAGAPFPLAELPGRRALQGTPVPETLLRFRVVATGEERWALVSGTPGFDDQGRVQFAVNIFHDITEHQRAAETLQARARQQAAIAELGQRALGGLDLPALLDDAVLLVAQTLAAEYVGVMELLPGADRLLLRAGVGWQAGLVGHFSIGVAATSIAGYALLTRTPVIVADLRKETRFNVPPVLHEHGVVSSASVIIQGQELHYGVLNVLTRRLRTFSPDDIHFLQAIANVLAAAIERRRAEDERTALLLGEQAAREAAEATQQRLAFLADASRVLAASLDYQTTLASVARLAVPRLADWCVVDIVGEDGSIQRLAVEHVDPAKIELALALQQRYPADEDSPGTIRGVIRTGQPTLVPVISDAQLIATARDDTHLQMLRSLGLRSYMIVPLVVRGLNLGAIALVMAESGRTYGPDDLALAEELAQRAATAVDNARLYQEAQAAIGVRDEFLSIASHELKTPVTALLGYAQVLQRRTARQPMANERDRRALQVIVEQTERLNKLIVALLDLSRIQTGSLMIERGPVALCALGRRVVGELQAGTDRHTLLFSCSDAALVIDGDELRLEQVLQNLLQNAIKYSPGGGPITLRVEQRHDTVVIEVSDQGIGIPASALGRLFERFYRASNDATRNVSGLGIGLYVVHEIVHQHGGRVEVTSEEGQGSTFTVCLPLPQSSNVAPQVIPNRSSDGESPDSPKAAASS